MKCLHWNPRKHLNLWLKLNVIKQWILFNIFPNMQKIKFLEKHKENYHRWLLINES